MSAAWSERAGAVSPPPKNEGAANLRYQSASSVAVSDPKQAEIDYPAAIGEEGRAWLKNKPFHHEPRMTARLLIYFGHVLQILDLHAGMSLVELDCGSGWMTRFAARHGLHAHGYDIAPEMHAIAPELAAHEGVALKFDV